LIDHVAEQLGATKEQRKKWRYRGFVPAAWRYEIFQATKGRVTVFVRDTDLSDQESA
jgi:hypothetical protein